MRLKVLAMCLATGSMCLPASASASETQAEAPGPEGPLQGTLLIPADRPVAPEIAIIIPGSGPTDRNGNNPAGLAASSYRLLADALEQAGVATLRIDKRGMFGSAAAVRDANAVTLQDYAQDVGSWITVLRAQTGASCIWLIGHSEGGLVALQAAQSQADVCGVVLVAAAGRPLGVVIKEQLAANPANAFLLDQANAAIDEIAAGRAVDVTGMHPALRGLFDPAVQGYLSSVLAVDPARLVATLSMPVLIMQGTSDIQVSVADAERLSAAAPAAKLVLLDNVNHVLKTAPADDRAANIATYFKADLPLAEGVADAIAGFITSQSLPKQ